LIYYANEENIIHKDIFKECKMSKIRFYDNFSRELTQTATVASFVYCSREFLQLSVRSIVKRKCSGTNGKERKIRKNPTAKNRRDITRYNDCRTVKPDLRRGYRGT